MLRAKDFIYATLKKSITSKLVRRLIKPALVAALKKAILRSKAPKEASLDRYYLVRNLILTAFKRLDEGRISPDVLLKTFKNLVEGEFYGRAMDRDFHKRFKEQYGFSPPGFFVISPTQMCNLRCVGCYAASHTGTWASLPFDVSDRILTEAEDLLKIKFVVVSGGEPFLYRQKQNGKVYDFLDLIERHSRQYFLVYTNGTLITDEVAARMAELGNITPAISVEGFEKETDERRGKGVFEKILKAMENLRKYGVGFGISVTATKKNLHLLLGDDFYKFFFDKQGATYMWQFQLMPIGRGKGVFALMPSPSERKQLYFKWKELIKKHKYFVGDFWNSGSAAHGCIAFAGYGGYFYITWNGDVTPCVFIPYSDSNILEIYKAGGNIIDAIRTPFFERGRAWLHYYTHSHLEKPGSWLRPCSIRDHYKVLREALMYDGVKPIDKDAEDALKDPEYYRGLVEYDEQLLKEMDPIWAEKYSKEWAYKRDDEILRELLKEYGECFRIKEKESA